MGLTKGSGTSTPQWARFLVFGQLNHSSSFILSKEVLVFTHNKGRELGLYSTCGWETGGRETKGAPKTSRVSPVLQGRVRLLEPNN